MDIVKILSKDQQVCYNAVLQGENLFITAMAGSGKSFLINHIIQNIKKSVLLCASTGIAATLIGGRTLHSTFMISPNQDAQESLSNISFRKAEKIKKAEILIIDEISMVSDKMLNCVDEICKKVRECQELPFGGLQLIFCGDFLQLPPVFKGANEGAKYCIYAKSWADANIKPFLLTTNFRQADDLDFFDILTQIRENRLDDISIKKLKAREYQKPDDNVIRLYSTNNEVDNYNQMMFDKLEKKPTKKYAMSINGDPSIVQNFLKNSLFEEELFLRKKARVMLLANMTIDNVYLCNGSLGTIAGFEGRYPIVQFDCGLTTTIKEHIVEQFEREYSKEGELLYENQVLHVEQIPLKLAYAISIHKSQGQTFDKVFIDCTRVFSYGQIYVALSRAKSLNGLYLRNFWANKAQCEPIMAKWYIQLEEKQKSSRG